jgi:CheY-like chemotaxis protein
MKVFIVDDDNIFRMIASKTLSLVESSLDIIECENGKDGLHGLNSLKDSHQKIIVLLDINMPVMDGWSFLEQLKKNDLYNLSNLNIYIVSSSTDKNDILKAEQFEFVKGFIHKPLNEANINAIISES